MKVYASAGYNIAPGGESLMHCWRGGMRSNSMAWLFNTVGIKTRTLSGGYKSYRRYVLNSFQKSFNMVVIGGMTGSGKTAVIEALESMGEQIVHLERLANHKGSVFGGIGMPDQPSTEQFENNLYGRLRELNPERPVFIEDESLAIGQVFIPRDFYGQMSAAPLINLVVPLNRRIENLVETYVTGNPELIITGVKRIERRLGLEHAGRIIQCIKAGDMDEAVGLILRYYDKVYARSMALHNRKETSEICAGDENAGDIAYKIKDQRLKIKDN
jgi:tRNA 2-selenouridine synthase